MPKDILKFPEGFLWGAATAAHQAEGGNNNDWTEWEKLNADRLAQEARGKLKGIVPDWNTIKTEAANPNNYISGKAADHYNRYKEDIAIIKTLNLNAYRFTIEWSRIEPKEGQWDELQIAHYQNVISELKQNGIQPVITLWHRTLPLWVARTGGWHNKKTLRYFLRFTRKISNTFGQDVNFWTVLNEPILCVAGSYLGGQYPPNRKNICLAFKVYNLLVKAHIGAYQIIKQENPTARVGIAHAAVYLEPFENKFVNKIIVKIGHWFMNFRYLKAINNFNDFIGIQYYSRGLLNFSWSGLWPKITQVKTITEQSDMGWEVYPEGLYNFIQLIKKFNKPIMVTENGIADKNDALRENYIKKYLAQLHRAIRDGTKILGYIHWSLIDNLEWDKGFWPKFGLVKYDPQTFAREIRGSAKEYAKIAKENSLIC